MNPPVKQLVFPSFTAFRCVADALGGLDYARLQYVPGSPRSGLGAEFSILRAYLLNSEAVLLRGSRFHSIYQRLLKYTRPTTEALANLFFHCQPVATDKVSNLFNPHDLNQLLSEKILSAFDSKMISNFRFVPIDQMLIACSPIRDYDQEEFVYFGSDTLMFRNLIASRVPSLVENTLEIGCGTGFLSIWMAQRSRLVTATDISQRALTITRVNAALNDAVNVAAIESDVYSEVAGRFEVIISNPPYMFLPDDESKRIHAYGGHFGMNITRRILIGLDKHLSANGVALIFSDSYMLENGTDTLCDLLLATLRGQPWQIIATQFDYQPVKGHAEFYRQHSVRHAIRYLVTPLHSVLPAINSVRPPA